MSLQFRRDTEANIIQFDPVLKEGEPLWDLDNKKLFIGDGQTPATELNSITGVTSAEVGDVLAEILDNGTSPNINFVYDSSESALNVSLDFTTPFNGEISTIVGFRGSLISDDSTVVFDSAAGKFVNLEEIVLSDFGPDSDNAFDLGSANKRFKTGNFYNINVKDQTVVEDIVINGLIKLEDSSIFFDSRTNTLSANIVKGDFYGSLIGEDSVTLVDALTGEIKATDIEADTIKLTTSINVPELFNESETAFANCRITLTNHFNLVGELVADPNILPQNRVVESTSFFNVFSSTNMINDDLTALGGDVSAPLKVIPNAPLFGNSIKAHNGDEFVTSGALFFIVDGANPVTTGADSVATTFGIFLGDGVNEIDDAPAKLFFNNQGVLSVPVLQTGVFEDSPTDTRPAGVKGMIIFNDTTGTFQGWTGTAWVDLSAPPGP